MAQNILYASDNYSEFDCYFEQTGIRIFLLVCGKSLQNLKIGEYFDNLYLRTGIEVVKFDKFQPNPSYESVVEGVRVFQENHCEGIVAVGGGSAIDVAKCIKLYSALDCEHIEPPFFQQEIIPNDIKFLAVPTTAGTGAEATRYAVIYYHGEKQSITNENCIPETVLMDSGALATLSLYQRKVTLLDALCHSIESFWSVNSTNESKIYSKAAIERILLNIKGYLQNDKKANAVMLQAAHLAGKAINITQTTSGHAMSYKLTKKYNIAHGHAVALCIKEIWPWMLINIDRCVDPRGKEYLKRMFDSLADVMGVQSAEAAADKFENIVSGLELQIPCAVENDYNILCKSVNPIRLKNNPILLDEKDIDLLYHRILRKN